MKDVLTVLAGNQNCDKTTLLNRLTDSDQHVGNLPGVTVEKKMGQIKSFKETTSVDLPGIYSLSLYTNEEVVTRDSILKDDPDLIVNIVDATNIERNLCPSLRLMGLQKPIVIALNMMDEVMASGNSIDVHALGEHLHCPTVSISASKNEGVDGLIRVMKEQTRSGKQAVNLDFCKGEVHRAIHSTAHVIEDRMEQAKVLMHFASTKPMEGDEPIQRELKLYQDDIGIIEKVVKSMGDVLQTDREAALADMCYSYIEELVADCVVKRHASSTQVRSEKIDGLLARKYLDVPIFILVMLCIFYLTLGPIGGTMQMLLKDGIAVACDQMANLLTSTQVSDWLQVPIIDGIHNGVGSVLPFLPVIVTLSFFLSLLGDSRYMAWVAFAMNKLLCKIGLSDRNFVSMLVGFSCSIPAIMFARTLGSGCDRKMIIVVTPFMSCGARLPIYGMTTAAFFPEHTALILVSTHPTGILVAILSALLLKSTMFKGNSVPFVMELPFYRILSAKDVVLHMWEEAKGFLCRAFTIIFVTNIVTWFSQSCDFSFIAVAGSTDPMLASIGIWIFHTSAPLGFRNWRAGTALVTRITAKGSVVSTLSVLAQTSSDAGLSATLQTILTPVSAFAYLRFTVLYMPCIAVFVATRRELGSIRRALGATGYQTLVAYLIALLAFRVGSTFFRLDKAYILACAKGRQGVRI